MRIAKKFLISIVLLFSSVSSFAQSSSVTLQVTDAGAQTWNNGTWAVLLVSQPGATTYGPPFNLTTGGSVPNQSQSGALNATGGASITLSQNSFITPTQSKWQFTVCPASGIPSQCYTSSVTIAGASPTVTLTPPAISVTCGPGVSAYADAEVSCGVGGQYYSVTIGGNRQCTAVTGNTCTTWTSAGVTIFNAKNYGAIGDTKSSRACTTTASSSTVTSTDNPWLASDVGRKLQATASGSTRFGASGPTSEVTITAFNSAGSISVSPSVANASATGMCIWYTQQDDTKILAAYSAADAASQKALEPAYGTPTLGRPGQVFLPKGGYTVCGTIYNDFLTHVSNNTEGVSLIGEPGTDIYVGPCFVPPNASSNGTLINLYLNQRAEIAHFNINGVGFTNTNFANAQFLFGTLTSGKTWIHDVTINEWGSTQSNTAAFAMVSTSGLSRIENLQVQNAPGGDISIGCWFDVVAVDIISSFCSNHNINFKVNSSGQRTVFGPHFVLHGYQNDECGTNGLACFQITNSTVNCIGCELLNPGGGVGSVSLDTTSVLYLTDSTLYTYASDTGNSSGLILAGNAQVFATGSNISGNNTSAAVAGPATSKFWDLGGNLVYNQAAGVLTPCTVANFLTCAFSGGVVPTFPLLANATTQLGSRQVVNGTAPTFAVTGFGTGPTVAVQTGSTDAAGVVIITAGTTPGSSGTFTLTFSTVVGAYGTNTPACIFGLQNGTGSWNALAQEPVVQTPTTTSVVGNWADNSVALTAASTYGFVWSCYGK